MKFDASLMNREPESVDEAWSFIEALLAEQPHGKTFWQMEQEKEHVRSLCWWIRERLDRDT